MGSAKAEELKSSLLFFGKFFKHGTRIASIWPSSKSLAKATIKEVDWDKAQVIVELGAGTGPITDQIIKRLKPHTTFIAIEFDADFARILRKRFTGHKNVEIIHGDVRQLDTILKARGIKKVDYFVSGLGTPTLPEGVKKRMLASVRKYMPPHGVYSNITEFPYYYLRFYKKIFKDVDFKMVVVNMPPAGVYHCRAMK